MLKQTLLWAVNDPMQGNLEKEGNVKTSRLQIGPCVVSWAQGLIILAGSVNTVLTPIQN